MVVFSFYFSAAIRTYFFSNRKTKITFPLAIAGALEMKPVPWTAVTPSARILKTRTACAFDLSDFERFLIITQCQITEPRSLT